MKKNLIFIMLFTALASLAPTLHAAAYSDHSSKLSATLRSEIHIPDYALHIFTGIGDEADKQQQNEGIVSAKELSKKEAVLSLMTNFNLADYRDLLEAAHTLNTRTIITDVLADFTLQRFDKNRGTIIKQLANFTDCPRALNSLKKQLYLTQQLKDAWKDSSIRFSIQDLLDNQLIETFADDKFFLCGKNIDDLTGLKHISFADADMLLLNYNYLTTLESDEFIRLPKLRKLAVAHNPLTDIQPNAFAGLAKLEELFLEENRLTHIGLDTCAGLEKLRWLRLNGNCISTIACHAFVGSAHLQQLDLARNTFTEITSDMFTDLAELESLTISYNKAESLAIAANAFINIPKLQRLFLDDNKITSVAPGAFAGLHNLKGLYLRANHIGPDERTRIEAEVRAASPNAAIVW